MQDQDYMDPNAQPTYENYDDGGAVPDLDAAASVGGSYIECQTCTYHNDPSLSRCEICDSAL